MQTRSKRNSRKLDPVILKGIVNRVVQLAHPDRIILFGSAARGEMGPNSDVDLLLIKSGRFNRGRLIEKIYRGMGGLGQPVDIVIVTPEEVEQYGQSPYLVIAPALKDGKLVYAA
jgi:predicted nucleotidyltransferase